MKSARVLLSALVVMSLLAARRRAVESPSPQPPLPPLRSERSLVITEKSVIAGFTLDRVLGALIARSVAPSTTPEKFYRQMFDTTNTKPGLDASMPHCDDVMVAGKATFNDYVRRCPSSEGGFASDKFDAREFIPTAVVNRFDMADPNGANCGQYRITIAHVYENRNDIQNLIFEGTLPNPTPAAGIAGCRPVAQFWADLSAVDSIGERRARLERFFFDGIDGFEPVLQPDHYRSAPNGIRHFFFIAKRTRSPRFLQFRVVNECRDGACRIYARPDGLENFPSLEVFDSHDMSARAVAIREAFLRDVKNLAVRDLNGFSMTMPSDSLLVENETTGTSLFFLPAGVGNGQTTAAGQEFTARIESELRNVGSPLTAFDVLVRGATLNCVGCHSSTPVELGDGLKLPEANLFQEHVSRLVTEDGEAGTDSRFKLSPAMRDVFVPNRLKILTDFLKSGKPPTHSQ